MGTKRYCNKNVIDCGTNDLAFGFNFVYNDLALAVGPKCNLTAKYDDLKYEIGSLIDYYTNKIATGTSSIADYYYINLFINKYVAEKTVGKENQYNNVYGGSIIAEDIYREIVKQNTGSVFTNNISGFVQSGKIYKSNDINVTGVSSGAKFDVKMVDSVGKDYSKYAHFTSDGSSYKVKICTDKTDDLCEDITAKLPEGNYSISIKTTVNKTVPVAAFYECNLVFPEYAQGTYTEDSLTYPLKYNKPATKLAYMVPAHTKNEEISNTFELEGQFSYSNSGLNNDSTDDDNNNSEVDDNNNNNDNNDDNDDNDTNDNDEQVGTINLKVVDKNNKILANTKLKVCADKKCADIVSEGSVQSGAVYKIKNLEYGKYYVSIYEVPDGYVKPNTVVTLTLDSESHDEVITIDAKTVVPDTLSNLSVIAMVCGIIGIILGGYLMYINIKKSQGTES